MQNFKTLPVIADRKDELFCYKAFFYKVVRDKIAHLLDYYAGLVKAVRLLKHLPR